MYLIEPPVITTSTIQIIVPDNRRSCTIFIHFHSSHIHYFIAEQYGVSLDISENRFRRQLNYYINSHTSMETCVKYVRWIWVKWHIYCCGENDRNEIFYARKKK